MTDAAKIRDVQIRISILHEVVGVRDLRMTAALVNEEAEFLEGKTDKNLS